MTAENCLNQTAREDGNYMRVKWQSWELYPNQTVRSATKRDPLIQHLVSRSDVLYCQIDNPRLGELRALEHPMLPNCSAPATPMLGPSVTRLMADAAPPCRAVTLTMGANCTASTTAVLQSGVA